MTQLETPNDDIQKVADAPRSAGLSGWWRRRGPRKTMVWLHRWSALVLGIVLLAVTTSGAVLLYRPNIVHVQHAAAYAPAAGPGRVSFAAALDAVHAHDPQFAPQSIYRTGGVLVAENFDSSRRVTVDPSTGRVLGDFSVDKGRGPLNWTLSLLYNLHVCGLTCEGYVGYQAWLGDPVPGTSWLGFDGEPVNWGGLMLGVMGVLLLFLAISGIWFWWPGVRRFAVGLRVRMRRGRYARDYDLHQVAGMIAVPLLLLWAVTGMSYEFGVVEDAWFAAVPGSAAPDRDLTSHRSKAPDIGTTAAVAAAQQRTGSTERPVAIDLPAAGDATATYGLWFADGFDPWAHGDYPGDLLVSVDRHNATRSAVTYGGDQSRANTLWNDFNYPLHAGLIVGPYLRIVWFVLGLTPLLLAVTGVSTWLYKRSLRRRRRTVANPA